MIDLSETVVGSARCCNWVRTVASVMAQFGCDRHDAQRYCDLREEGYPMHQAKVLAGLSDPQY